MSTWVDLNIITGRTGTAHVSSADDASIWRGISGEENAVLGADNRLSLTRNVAGSLTVASGVFCMAGGHMGRISQPQNIDYGLPDEGSYRRTYVVIRYNISSNVESMKLMTLQSDPNDDVAPTDQSTSQINAAINTAKGLEIETENTENTTDFVLYDFVCGHDGVVNSTFKQKFTLIDTIPSLRADLDYMDQELYDESYARQQVQGDHLTRIVNLETWKTQKNTSDEGIASRVETLEAKQISKPSPSGSTSSTLTYSNLNNKDILIIFVRRSIPVVNPTSWENITFFADLRTCNRGDDVFTENKLVCGDYYLKISLKEARTEGYPVTAQLDRKLYYSGGSYTLADDIMRVLKIRSVF